MLECGTLVCERRMMVFVARTPRQQDAGACRRCADLEERERELLRNQGSLQEALVQVGARAQAAEEKLEKRIGELQSEHKEVITVMTTNAAASLEVWLYVHGVCSTIHLPACLATPGRCRRVAVMSRDTFCLSSVCVWLPHWWGVKYGVWGQRCCAHSQDVPVYVCAIVICFAPASNCQRPPCRSAAAFCAHLGWHPCTTASNQAVRAQGATVEPKNHARCLSDNGGGVQLAKAESMETAQKQAQGMIEEAKEERRKVCEAMELEKSNLEKLLGSVTEELQYWQTRTKRTEAACTALQADVLSLARMLPDDMSSMKLAVEGKISRTLIERAAEGMAELVALDDEWLPPLDTEPEKPAASAAAADSAGAGDGAESKAKASSGNGIPRRKSMRG